MKYTTVKISGVITQISKETDIEGYTEGILEILYPEGHEEWSNKKANTWIKKNNERMEAICQFLNEREK